MMPKIVQFGLVNGVNLVVGKNHFLLVEQF